MKKIPWSELKSKRLSGKQQKKLMKEAAAEVIEFSLRELREKQNLTQVDVAKAAGMNQSELSRVERRGDVKLSTLKRVVQAIGGDLEIVAVVDGERVPIGVGS